jgi:hypothetical protein
VVVLLISLLNFLRPQLFVVNHSNRILVLELIGYMGRGGGHILQDHAGALDQLGGPSLNAAGKWSGVDEYGIMATWLLLHQIPLLVRH